MSLGLLIVVALVLAAFAFSPRSYSDAIAEQLGPVDRLSSVSSATTLPRPSFQRSFGTLTTAKLAVGLRGIAIGPYGLVSPGLANAESHAALWWWLACATRSGTWVPTEYRLPSCDAERTFAMSRKAMA